METTALSQITSFSRAPHHNMVHPSLGSGQSLPEQYAPVNYYSAPCDVAGSAEVKPETQATDISNTKDKTENDESSNIPSVEIFISNVVCTFSVRCHLNLKRIGMEGHNVEYIRESGKVMMKLRRPYCTATIWSSGKITVTGSSSEADAKKSARRVARNLQKLGFKVHFHQFQVVNVLGTCRLPFAIRISKFSEQHPQAASYEPEIHPAVTYRIKSPKATLKIFSTGSITVTAPSVENVDQAINHIYPLVEPFQMEQAEKPAKKERSQKQGILVFGKREYNSDEDETLGDEEEEEWESELSDDDLEPVKKEVVKKPPVKKAVKKRAKKQPAKKRKVLMVDQGDWDSEDDMLDDEKEWESELSDDDL